MQQNGNDNPGDFLSKNYDDGSASNQRKNTGLSDKETSALVAAATVIAFFAVYWFLQIQSVRELLKLAYG